MPAVKKTRRKEAGFGSTLDLLRNVQHVADMARRWQAKRNRAIQIAHLQEEARLSDLAKAAGISKQRAHQIVKGPRVNVSRLDIDPPNRVQLPSAPEDATPEERQRLYREWAGKKRDLAKPMWERALMRPAIPAHESKAEELAIQLLEAVQVENGEITLDDVVDAAYRRMANRELRLFLMVPDA